MGNTFLEPQMDTDKHRLNQITEAVIGCAFEVSNTLGIGFLEKVYENALFVELNNRGIRAEKQVKIDVVYANEVVGEYVADLLVEGVVLVELKAVKALSDVHMAQCINYLKATGIRICLLLNFGQARLGIKRIIR